jgi:hypothetical protein
LDNIFKATIVYTGVGEPQFRMGVSHCSGNFRAALPVMRATCVASTATTAFSPPSYLMFNHLFAQAYDQALFKFSTCDIILACINQRLAPEDLVQRIFPVHLSGHINGEPKSLGLVLPSTLVTVLLGRRLLGIFLDSLVS